MKGFTEYNNHFFSLCQCVEKICLRPPDEFTIGAEDKQDNHTNSF